MLPIAVNLSDVEMKLTEARNAISWVHKNEITKPIQIFDVVENWLWTSEKEREASFVQGLARVHECQKVIPRVKECQSLEQNVEVEAWRVLSIHILSSTSTNI